MLNAGRPPEIRVDRPFLLYFEMTLYIILLFIALCAGMALSVYAFGTGGKRKRIFQDIYFSVEDTNGVGVLYTKTGEYSAILKIENPVQKYCANIDSYYEFTHLFTALAQTLGEGYALHKQDIFIRKQFENETGDKHEFLSSAYFRYFKGRNYTDSVCYLTITQEAKKSRLFSFDNWKIQCKLPPKTKRFCPLKTFNNAPLKSLDRWGYYYFSLFPSVCSHFTDTFSCQLNPVRRMYNTIHNGICYCRVSDCIIPIVRWQLRGDDDGLAPMSVLYYIEQDGSFLGIKVHKEEVIQYEQRAPFDSLEFRFQCAFYFCHLKRTHKFRSIRIICPYALLAGFIPHCCGKEALPGTG